VLFAWVDLHDLRAVLELSLTEVQGSWMKERMYRAQEEVSLFGKAIVNLCEEMNARRHPSKLCCSKDYAQLFKFAPSLGPENAHGWRCWECGSVAGACR